MTRLIFFIVLAASMAGCHAAAPQEPDSVTSTAADRWREKVIAAKRHVLERGLPRKVSRGAKPEIVLRNNQLSYNGRPLTLGSDLDTWRQVLGPEAPCDSDYREYNLHCWNNLGIWVRTSRKRDNRVDLLHVFLNQIPKPWGHDIPNISPLDGKPVPDGINFYHSHLFNGYLELDGAGVDAKSKTWEVAELATGDYTYKCIREISGCSIGPADQKYDMSFITDGDLEEGLIYEFQMSLFD